jgi:MtN3 and saliva related transmembrane protein
MLQEIFTLAVIIFGILMSAAHFPQALKILKTKSAKDISLVTYSIFTLGAYVWLVYGFVINELPIILSFVIAVIGTTLVLLLAVKFR